MGRGSVLLDVLDNQSEKQLEVGRRWSDCYVEALRRVKCDPHNELCRLMSNIGLGNIPSVLQRTTNKHVW